MHEPTLHGGDRGNKGEAYSQPDTQTKADVNLPEGGCGGGEGQSEAADQGAEKADGACAKSVSEWAADRADEVIQGNRDREAERNLASGRGKGLLQRREECGVAVGRSKGDEHDAECAGD